MSLYIFCSSILGTEGLEPSRTITRQRILSPSCLPIPPRPQCYINILQNITIKCKSIATILKAAPRFELGIEDLQSTALPLGHTAILLIIYIYIIYNLKTNNNTHQKCMTL